ncbi:MAG: MBL fold metallo-hydrolase, partial [Candidatus Heimdallarchaeaceae archaeon]
MSIVRDVNIPNPRKRYIIMQELSLISMVSIHRIKLGYVNSFLIKENNNCILVDTGMPKSHKKIVHFLQKNSIQPENIKLIIITHAHIDHIGSVKEIKEITGAEVLMHKIEAELVEKGDTPEAVLTNKLLKKIFSSTKREIAPFSVDIKVSDEFSLKEYGFDAKIIHTLGHTDGSISLIFKQKHAFVGDIVMKFPLLSGRSYFPIVANEKEKIYESWKKLIDLGVEWLYPSHGKIFPIRLLEKEM